VAAARLAELCDHVPPAVRILAERIARQPATRLAEFVDDLLERQDRLDAFDADDAGTNLRTVAFPQLDVRRLLIEDG
jgi:hypothetical protein